MIVEADALRTEEDRQPFDSLVLALAAFAVFGRSSHRFGPRATRGSTLDIDVRPLIPLAIVLWPDQRARKSAGPTRPPDPVEPDDPVAPKKSVLSVDPQRTKPGGKVTIMGLGSYAKSAGFHWKTPAGTPLSATPGDGTATVVVPEDASVGTHWICVVDTSRPFSVEPGPGRVQVVVETEGETAG